jgi:hypothetical protein
MNCVAAFGEPLNESSASATAALREGVRERRRSEWSIPFVRSLTKQTARKACPFGVAAKSSAHRVALFDIVDTATTCVVRLVIIPILSATRPRGIHSEVPWEITKRVKGVRHIFSITTAVAETRPVNPWV